MREHVLAVIRTYTIPCTVKNLNSCSFVHQMRESHFSFCGIKK